MLADLISLNTDHDVTDGVEHCLANCTLLWVEQLAGLVLQPPEAGAEVGEAVLGLQVGEQLLHLRGPHTAPGVAAAQRAVARAADIRYIVRETLFHYSIIQSHILHLDLACSSLSLENENSFSHVSHLSSFNKKFFFSYRLNFVAEG